MSAAPYLKGFDWVKIRDEFSLGLHHKSVKELGMEFIHIELEDRQRLRELIQAIKDVPDENDDEGTSSCKDIEEAKYHHIARGL